MPPKRYEQQKTTEIAKNDDKNSQCLEKQLREREIDERMKIASLKNIEISRRHKEVTEDKRQAEARQQAVNFNINVSQIRYKEEDDDRIKGFGSGRSRGRGRGRGQASDRGRGRGEGFRRTHDRPKRVNSEDEKWRLDRQEIDRARIDRQKNEKGFWKREWDTDKQSINPQPPTPKQTVPHRPAGRIGSGRIVVGAIQSVDGNTCMKYISACSAAEALNFAVNSQISENREFDSRNRGRGSYGNRPKSTHFETFKNFKITTDGGGRQVEGAVEVDEFEPGPSGSTGRREDFDKGRGVSGGNRRQQRGRVRRGSPKNRPESGETRVNIGQWRGRGRGRGRGEGRSRGQRRRPFPNVDDVNVRDKNPDDEYHEDDYIDAPEPYYESGPEDEKKISAVTDSTDSLHKFIEENTLKVNKDGELLDSKSQSTDTSPKSLTLTTPTPVTDWGAEMEKQEMNLCDEIPDAIADATADETADKEANKIIDAKDNGMANATANEETKPVSDVADVTKDASIVEVASANPATETAETVTDNKTDVKEIESEENTRLIEDNKTSIPSDTILENTTDKISDSSPESRANNPSKESREERESPTDNNESEETEQKAESKVILKDGKADENQEIEGNEKTTEEIGNSVSSGDMYKIAYTDSC
ncbi:DgyrCDS9872 [Dimorphilus gyrociliatus]|uniref:DgyrCDS9872 n=1 Tax=Dimorphilus gyrociliatus TaxID=2664684 RepID=A0A7I8W109_9ANNE|nr:DgyrCDS9872 [Dimorphilus gyrociliatus]